MLYLKFQCFVSPKSINLILKYWLTLKFTPATHLNQTGTGATQVEESSNTKVACLQVRPVPRLKCVAHYDVQYMTMEISDC